ncbi:MAG: hypothetical protein JW940_18055 [Polyangiaceae bacterium]|nr:hypothetical protein [Polyangiaceae bacterium]
MIFRSKYWVPRVLFICGSRNQTTQMIQVAEELAECERAFTPYYGAATYRFLSRLGLLEFTIAGHKMRRRCADLLLSQELPIDIDGWAGGYDLVVTCSDVLVPENLGSARVVLLQEGIMDPATFLTPIVRRFPTVLPRWLAGTAATGLSRCYDRFCVASEGYRDHFIAQGAPASKLVVTGIPNFDDCERYRVNSFPCAGYVLACTSDARETFKLDRRRRFIEHVVDIAHGRDLIFKLHPNENVRRATQEIERWAPGARVYADGSAEEMVANCSVLVCQYSSLAFVGLALGKEVHSYFPHEELRRLLPIQNRCAAHKVASACRNLLGLPARPQRSAQPMNEVRPARGPFVQQEACA